MFERELEAASRYILQNIALLWPLSVVVTAIVSAAVGPRFIQVFRFFRQMRARLPRWLRSRATVARKAGATDLSRHPEWRGQQTATHRELANFEGENRVDSYFDFAGADRQLVKRYFFGYAKFCKPHAEYDGAPHALSDELVERYSTLAAEFFGSPVVLKTDNSNLYDDEEAAVIASMFRKSDRPILYAMDKFRRVVGSNALRLTLQYFCFVVVLLSAGWALHLFEPLRASPAASWTAFGLVCSLCFAFSLWTTTVYAKARDSGMAEFSGLLERYFAGVSDKFHQASAKMIGAILGEEEDHDALAANAQKWHRLMMWQGLRTFFIESFLRCVNFQMRRNLGFYGLLAFFLLVVVPIVSVILAWPRTDAGSLTLANLPSHPATWTVASLVLGGMLFLQAQKKEIDAALSQKDWRGFESLQLDDKMRDILGKYAQEAAIGKRRGVIRPGGGVR